MSVHPATLRVLGIQYQFLLSSKQQNKDKSSAFAVLWIRISINLAVPDPDPRACKLTEIIPYSKELSFPVFQKAFCKYVFDLLRIGIFHVRIKLFVTLKSD